MIEPRDPSSSDAADRQARDLLANLPSVPPGADLRVRHAVRTSQATPGTRWALWTGGGLVVVSAAAAAWIVLQPAPPVAPVALAQTLESGDGWTSESLLQEVSLSFSGTGTVEGTSQRPQIKWERGTVNVEVQPNRGIDLTVATREAEVRVVGTGFSVARDALGTRVEVLHGKVAVTCTSGESVTLEGGASHTCLPASPAALLGRARALDAGGAAPAEVLATLERGLALTSPGPVQDELRVRRIEVLVRTGNRSDALRAAHDYLEGGASLRRTEVRRIAANLGYTQGGCRGAGSDLRALVTEADATPEDHARLAACTSP